MSLVILILYLVFTSKLNIHLVKITHLTTSLINLKVILVG